MNWRLDDLIPQCREDEGILSRKGVKRLERKGTEMIPTCRNTTLYLLCCGLAAVTSGCAFGTRHVTLSPMDAPGVRPVDGGGDISVAVELPRDLRVEKAEVGCVRNGWGMQTARVVADRSVPEWIHQNVCRALEQCGFRIVTSPSDGTCEVTVLFTVDKAYCDCKMKYEAEVSLEAEVRVAEKTVSRRNYRGQASSMNWAATSAGYEKNLNDAMRSCLATMIPDLRDAIVNARSAVSAPASFCQHCGARGTGPSKFCASCGKSLAVTAAIGQERRETE